MHSTPEWIARSVSRLRSITPPAHKAAGKAPDKATDEAGDKAAKPAPSVAVADGAAPRSTHERLHATLRRGQEALPPRALRRLLTDLQEVVAAQVSEHEGGRRAQAVAAWYAQAEPGQRRDMWLLMCEQFAPDATRFESARQRYEAAAGTDEEGQAEISLRRALVSQRTRLLQRFAVFPEGLRFLLDMRAELLPLLKSDKRLLALDAELEHLFGTWFDVAFLELRRLSWDSPASLIEKLIKYEAVHDIRSWADLKNRLDCDRRCYGFFHPRLPSEPLIFVEVALVDQISHSIAPLLDEAAAPADLSKATTAVFYSISNTQTGLRGVGFGDALIKHVVQTLTAEFPRLRTFATLSPIPGFRAWLGKHAGAMIERLDDKRRAELGRALGVEHPQAAPLLAASDKALELDAKSPVRQLLQECAAYYLGRAMQEGKPLDPVARFHLGNGARVERLNWAGDPSSKGLKQSYGLMVNYLYDLKRIDKHRSLLAQGKVPVSAGIDSLCHDR
ncbi:malonyl-CoA decarboxylase [Verminephrobacter eiseniae]|uniref:malonyl-CoA decarboxylase n=1 Tax=Verminephrobacter eiseniae TaxID=364317 RepID=UPI0022378631|nr:malonyl-CoA decarboxylase [Verminephrobacter eiseniae]MCW5232066.1 malonyl-CoA decarboxylase [Verminephrobacter eiseniae]MCW5296372.1 malonyl-CoA decarboxylase [Verminephrobacter eiseniae]MCW8186548.1 malonyl-CoA decarboxylase [Verminephrobacter eiseniae]MCW8224979.1 malonyl-CoA decarboxylase [Verminephrobacter eiseniae]MCW8232935.1 malonyl-CoA decarboxylase [Verminephrobacter eiseniae]